MNTDGTTTARRGWSRTRIEWGTVAFISLMHLAGVAGVIHLVLNFSWWTLLLGIAWYYLCGMSISAGYHRLFSHRAYRASLPVRLFLLGFGAAACQRSALKWCADHREHHRHSDEPADPYSVRDGFWWAHIGWVISDGEIPQDAARPRDLDADPLVRFQERYWIPIAVLLGGILPAAIASLWGDMWGGLLFAGCTRIVVLWQVTYSVNSIAHCFGRQTCSRDTSARDSNLLALATFGEGYHNFHHRFQSDYRNGVRWFHYDPTKWLLWTLARFRLVRDLKRTPRDLVRRSRAGAAA